MEVFHTSTSSRRDLSIDDLETRPTPFRHSSTTTASTPFFFCTMVRPSVRRDTLEKLRLFLQENAHYFLLKETRHSFLSMITIVETLDMHRYLDRSFIGPTFYVRRGYKLEEVVNPMGRAEIKECFRMSLPELERLVEHIGDHAIFHPGRGRPQKPVSFQIAVFLYRLGRGATISDVCRTMGRIGRGSVTTYCMRTIVAILTTFNNVIKWPDPRRREAISTRLRRDYGIPGCVGFIDGSHIPLHKCPSFSIEKNASFFSRKHRYGLLILAVCDEAKRFTYLQTGHYASASDFRAQRSSALHRRPRELFSRDQFVLGDSGFYCSLNVIPMYRRRAAQDLTREQQKFNDRVAKARVKIEHAFGVLKLRWLMLNDINLTMKTDKDINTAFAYIRTAVVLHNLYIHTANQHWSLEDFERAKAKAEEEDRKADPLPEGELLIETVEEDRMDRRDRLARRVAEIASSL